MATEILGFLIIVGILIVFIVRRDLWNGSTASSKAEEVEEASVKMRLQMEHSADAIITRMESHIHQLESLVAAADERARVLEKQLATVREDQERAQRKAEQEFAAMRAAQASYYPPREDKYAEGYEEAMRRQPWPAREEYRPRVQSPQFSMRPIDEVSSVRRTDYAVRERMDQRGRDEGFAEALSASMHEAQNTYRSEPRRERPAPAYYGNGDYGQGGYGNHYEAMAYPAESYPTDDTWEQYVEEPRRPAPSRAERGFRRISDVPVEMVVEETPAVIVEPRVTNRRGDDYLREEPEEEGPVFSPKQMEELAKTEAEVVVSSSVADVVDLPVHSDEAAGHGDVSAFNEGQETAAPEEDVHGFAEPEEMGVPEADVREFEDEEESPSEDNPDFMEGTETEPMTEEEPFEAEDDRATGLPEELSAEFSERGKTWVSEADEVEDSMPTTAETVASQEESAASESDEEEEAPQGEIFAFMGEEEITSPMFNVETSDEQPDGSKISAALRETRREAQNTADDSREQSPTVRARKLLAQGMSPAEAARATRMGRSAVELLAQMAKSMGKTQDSD